MIDPQTGYDDTPQCFCKPCAKCDGEGAFPVQVPLRIARNGDVLEYEHRGEWSPCSKCNGTGKDSSDCEVSVHWPKDDPEAA